MALTALSPVGGRGEYAYWPASRTPASTCGPEGCQCQVLRPLGSRTNASPPRMRKRMPEASCHIIGSFCGAMSNGRVSATAPGGRARTSLLVKKPGVSTEGIFMGRCGTSGTRTSRPTTATTTGRTQGRGRRAAPGPGASPGPDAPPGTGAGPAVGAVAVPPSPPGTAIPDTAAPGAAIPGPAAPRAAIPGAAAPVADPPGAARARAGSHPRART